MMSSCSLDSAGGLCVSQSVSQEVITRAQLIEMPGETNVALLLGKHVSWTLVVYSNEGASPSDLLGLVRKSPNQIHSQV